MADWMFFKKIDIVVNKELYLRRWVLARTPWGQILLHKICKPDPDRELHDHPWHFKSLILKGGYTEYVQDGLNTPTYVRNFIRGQVNSHGCLDFHRIAELNDNKPAWSLVFTGYKRKTWYFLVDGLPMQWQRFLKLKGLPMQEDLADDW